MPVSLPILRDERGCRQREVRSRVLGRISKSELEFGKVAYPDVPGVERPRTRADCVGCGSNAARPCPYVSCKWHLYLDVNPETGAIKLNFPDLEPGDMRVSCALDLAEQGGLKLEEVGMAINITRERVRQLQDAAICGVSTAILTGVAEIIE